MMIGQDYPQFVFVHKNRNALVLLFLSCLAVLLCVHTSNSKETPAADPVVSYLPSHFNRPGNTLMVNGVGGLVLEVTPEKEPVWLLDSYRLVVPGDPSRRREVEIGLPMAVRLPNGNTLLTCAEADLVVEVDRKGRTVWYYGSATKEQRLNPRNGKRESVMVGRRFKGPGYLTTPQSALPMKNGNILICDYIGNMIEVNRNKKIVWHLTWQRQHGYRTGDMSTNTGWAVPLENGDILLYDVTEDELFEIHKDGKVIWHRSPSPSGNVVVKGRAWRLMLDPTGKSSWNTGPLSPGAGYPMHVLGIGSGHLLVCHASVSEYDRNGRIVWEYKYKGEHAPLASFNAMFAQRIGNVALPLKKPSP